MQRRRLNTVVVAIATLTAGPLISIGFWAIDAYVVSAHRMLTPYERWETLPTFVAIGVVVGMVASALVVGSGRK